MFKPLLQISIVLALVVVVLGAYTRLSDAGLGCPDWPGCYGQLTVPNVADGSKIAGFDRPVEIAKGWKEMVHRYAASVLGLCILILFLLALKGKTEYTQSVSLPGATLGFVLLQGAFGMWTVTLLVHPGIVTLHLLGGFITTVLLSWLLLNQTTMPKLKVQVSQKHKGLLLLTVLALAVQIALGGWTSTNYAALACGEYFPRCLGSYWPEMDFVKAFYWGPLGVDYEYGVLENPARAAIQMLHRIGALIISVLILSMIYLFKRYSELRSYLILLFILLLIQVALGILNVVLSLPIVIATLHNLVALLLLLSLIGLIHRTFKKTKR